MGRQERRQNREVYGGGGIIIGRGEVANTTKKQKHAKKKPTSLFELKHPKKYAKKVIQI